MSSIVTRKNGLREIRFAYNGSQTLRLGRTTKRQAAAIQVHVDSLLRWRQTSQSIPPATMDWLAGLSAEMRQRLETKGLVEPSERRDVPTLADLVERYIARRSDVKAETKRIYRLSKARLLKHIDGGRAIDRITAGDAEDAYQNMMGDGLAEATARKTIAHAKQWFGYAVRHGWITANPFEGMASHVRENPERFRFITRAEIDAVIAACPDTDWKLIFALARYGGLRTPSETFALRWGDVDWEGQRIHIRSRKTERHEGHAERIIPLFPELADLLQQAFDEAPEGSECVVRWRDSAINLRTQAHRIIKRAKLTPWPKTFQNLRSSRQTELAEAFPIQCVCAWIGNSTEIARKHYLQVTDAHWERATEAHQNAHKQAAASECERRQGNSRDDDGSASQPVAAGCGGKLGRGGIRTHE